MGIFLMHLSLLVCAWIGCWIGTMGARRPSKFMRTLARGMVGGAVGGFLNPMLILIFAESVMAASKQDRVEVLQALPFLLAEGAVLSLPLAVLIAVRKRREPPIRLDPRP